MSEPENPTRLKITCGNCGFQVTIKLPRTMTVTKAREGVKSGDVECPKCHTGMPESSTAAVVPEEDSDR